MTEESEQSALEKIKAHLEAGYSMDEIRAAGWGEWIDYFENSGVDLTASSPAPAVAAEPAPAPNTATAPAWKPEPTREPEPEPAGQSAKAVENENVKRVEEALSQDPKLIALVGKAAGVGIIVIGLILSLWTAIDIGDFASTSDQIRSFLSDGITYIAFGTLVFLAAEILERVTTRT